MQKNITNALIKNLRGLATNLKGLSDAQLEESAARVRSFTDLLESIVEGLIEECEFMYGEIPDTSLHDENATLKAELSEMNEALVDTKEVREALQRIEDSLKTIQVRTELHNG